MKRLSHCVMLLLSIGFTSEAIAQSSVPPCMRLIQGESFDSGTNFNGQRTYIVHGYLQPTNTDNSQCFSLTSLQIDFAEAQATLQIAGVRVAAQQFLYEVSLDQAGISNTNNLPTVHFHTTTSRGVQITKLAFQVLITAKPAADTPYLSRMQADALYLPKSDITVLKRDLASQAYLNDRYLTKAAGQSYVTYEATVGIAMGQEPNGRCLKAKRGETSVEAQSPCDYTSNPDYQWIIRKK
jgi:hypothetical protein